MKLKNAVLLAGSLIALVACGADTVDNKEEVVADNTEEVETLEESKVEEGESEEIEEEVEETTQEIEEVEFVPFEDNEEAKRFASAMIGDDSDTKALSVILLLNGAFDEMFKFEKNEDKKIIVGYPIDQDTREWIEDIKAGDIKVKQAFYNVFSELDYMFLGGLNAIDDDYEIHVLDEKESDNKLIIFNKDGYLHNSFGN